VNPRVSKKKSGPRKSLHNIFPFPNLEREKEIDTSVFKATASNSTPVMYTPKSPPLWNRSKTGGLSPTTDKTTHERHPTLLSKESIGYMQFHKGIIKRPTFFDKSIDLKDFSSITSKEQLSGSSQPTGYLMACLNEDDGTVDIKNNDDIEKFEISESVVDTDEEPTRNWVGEFQTCLEKIASFEGHESKPFDRIKAFQKLNDLCADFKKIAKMYSTVIIRELGVPEYKKTLHVTPVGGLAGGRKFIVGGLLIKFADDSQGWGLDHRAPEKIAGLEFSGLLSYFNLNIAGLNFPLTCLIDYLGFRVICMSKLPIIGCRTLVYGSNDAGVTVHNSDPGFRWRPIN